MKQHIGKIINFVLIFGTLLVVLLVGLNGQELGNALEAMRSLGVGYVVLCTGCYLLHGASDAVSLWYFLRRQGCRVGFLYMLFVANAGLYYSNITPGASGGQPMQIYYLHKKGVPIGLASSALVVRFFSFQFMLSVFGTVLWIRYGAFIAQQIGDYKWILIVGYVYNLILVTFLLMLAFTKGIVRFFIRLFVRVGQRLHIVKDAAASTAKWEASLDTFSKSMRMLRHRPWDVAVQLLLGAVQLLSLMAVLYFIYLGLGLHDTGFGEIIAMHVMEYLSAAYIPSPGASGMQEVTFSLYFSGIFPGEGLRLAALLLWRFFTYYLSLLLGAVITVGYGWRVGQDRKAVLTEASDMQRGMRS